ncbi:hypothetical protein BH23ACT9_BH23ACT9_00260 [soil metagenome]
MEHFEEARALWQTHVPRRGQADTVQGELMRAVERLRDEAQRNGNLNWGPSHVTLLEYLRTTLLDADLFDADRCSAIVADADRLLDFEHPEVDDAPYDRLCDRVVEWARAHPDPIPHTRNPELTL